MKKLITSLLLICALQSFGQWANYGQKTYDSIDSSLVWDNAAKKLKRTLVPSGGGGGGGAVSSVFGRTGAVTAQTGDYTVSQVTNAQTTALTSGSINIGDGTNTAFPRALSGDVTVNNLGVTTISNNAVTNAKIANATIDLTTKVSGILPTANGGAKVSIVGPLLTNGFTNGTFTTVGTPSPSFSSGTLSFSGSTGFNQLVYCSSLGQSQFNNTSVTYTCTVGTINASSTGIGIGLYSLANWSAARVSYNATFSLSTTNRGKIIWDATYGGVNYPSLQISTSALTITSGDVLDYIFTNGDDSYTLTVINTTTGESITDKYVFSLNHPLPNAYATPAMSYHYAFTYLGGNHVLSNLSISCQNSKNADLEIGDSMVKGYFCGSLKTSTVGILADEYEGVFGKYAQSSIKTQDVNTAEIALLDPIRIKLRIGTNNLGSGESNATAFTNLQTLITALGALSTTNAPSGYSVANGNLFIATLPPRNDINVTAFNNSIKSGYLKSSILDLFHIGWSGTGFSINALLSPDNLHPNPDYNRLIAELYANKFNYTINNQTTTNTTSNIVGLKNSTFGYKYAVGSVNNQNKISTFDIANLSGASGLRVGNSVNEDGAYIGGTGGGVAHFASGMRFDGTNWRATNATGNALAFVNGQYTFAVTSGNTVGAVCTPTNFLVSDVGGNVIIDNLTGTALTSRSRLDVRDNGSQIRVGNSNTDEGMWLTGLGANTAIMQAGIKYNGTNQIAKSTSGGMVVLAGGIFGIYLGNGMTIGATSTASQVFTIDAQKNVLTGGLITTPAGLTNGIALVNGTENSANVSGGGATIKAISGAVSIRAQGGAVTTIGTNVGIGSVTPTARLHLPAGTATANTAPLKLNAGTNLTTPETGAIEYNGTNLFFTRSGTTRENVITSSAVNTVSPTAPNRTITVVIDGTTYYISAKTTND